MAEPFAAHFSATAKHVVDLLIGSILGLHYVITAKQFHFSQTDLQRVGLIVSISDMLSACWRSRGQFDTG
jgi:hypothetical protein